MSDAAWIAAWAVADLWSAAHTTADGSFWR